MSIVEQIKGMSPTERVKFLKEQATSIEPEGKYSRPLSPEEITFSKEKLAETSVVIADKIEVFAEIKAEHKAELKPLHVNYKTFQKQVKTRQEEMTGELYNFADQDDGTMIVMDKDGNVILERKLRPDEKQMSMVPFNNAANH